MPKRPLSRLLEEKEVHLHRRRSGEPRRLRSRSPTTPPRECATLSSFLTDEAALLPHPVDIPHTYIDDLRLPFSEPQGTLGLLHDQNTGARTTRLCHNMGLETLPFCVR